MLLSVTGDLLALFTYFSNLFFIQKKYSTDEWNQRLIKVGCSETAAVVECHKR